MGRGRRSPRLALFFFAVAAIAVWTPVAYGAGARGDFNGDGYSDLAISVDGEDDLAGAVSVLYGGSQGLSARDDQIWRPAGTDPEYPAPAFGRAVASGDFNDDGFADLAIGAPYTDVGLNENVGAVTVLYGGPEGLSAVGRQEWHQDVPGIEGDPSIFATFGWSLATGDFNGDGFADLGIGVPEEIGIGAVNVLYGGAAGLSAAGSQYWHQAVPGVPGDPAQNDNFGASLAAGDFNGNGFDDLAVGVPYADVGGVRNAGAVNVLYGSSTGLEVEGSQLWHQDVPGIVDRAENPDLLGSALATGDFDGGGFRDLAIGVPKENQEHPYAGNSGGVNVIYGGPTGLSADGDQFWAQNTRGVIGHSDGGDEFGYSLVAANFGKGATADLAVGTPGEDLAVDKAGAVTVLYGRAGGLSARGNQRWHQNSPGILGRAYRASNEDDFFGEALAAADFGNGTRADLAVGVPGKRVSAEGKAGVVNVLYGGRAGLSAQGNQLWHQDRPGVLDFAENKDTFGFALAPPGSAKDLTHTIRP